MVNDKRITLKKFEIKLKLLKKKGPQVVLPRTEDLNLDCEKYIIFNKDYILANKFKSNYYEEVDINLIKEKNFKNLNEEISSHLQINYTTLLNLMKI